MENKNIIRFEFTKKGGLKYISHLDLQRAISRIIKRSHIPIIYTQGFNPHPKMVFGLTLSVGCESECELLDVYMVMDESRPNIPLYTPEEFKKAILPNLPKGLDMVDAYYPTTLFTDIKSALYDISFDLNASKDLQQAFRDALSTEIVVLKKSKAGDKEIDIQPLIRDFSIIQNGCSLNLQLLISAEQNNYLNPELVLTGLKNKTSIFENVDSYSITRKKIIFSNQNT